MSFPRWLQRVLRWLLISMAGLGLLVAAFYGFENWQGARAWREYAAQSAARGEVLDVLPAPSTLPPERNFMKTPVLDRWAFGRGDDPEFLDFMKRVRLPQTEMRFADSKGLGGWTEFAWIDLGKTSDVWFGTPTTDKGEMISSGIVPDAQRLLALMAPMEPALDELWHAALERSESELARAVAIPGEQPLQAPIARFQLPRGLGYGLAAHGSAALVQKRHDAAFADSLAALKLARGYIAMSDPTLVESMTGVVVTKSALQLLWEGCQIHAWNDQELRQFQDELVAIHPVKSMIRAMRTERACMALTFDQQTGQVSLSKWLFWLRLPRGWIQRNKVAYCICMQAGLDILHAVGSSEFLQRRKEEMAKVDSMIGSLMPWQAPRTFVGLGAVPAFRKAEDHAVRAEAYVGLARTACALERYRLAKGGYPDALAALVPEFLDAVPLDVINGQPLRFLRTDRAAFVLYSVGLNGRDDGGFPEGWKNPEGKISDDWCWVQLVK